MDCARPPLILRRIQTPSQRFRERDIVTRQETGRTGGGRAAVPLSPAPLLIVEDDDGIATITAEILIDAGYTVTRAASPPDTLALFAVRGPRAYGLVLSDAFTVTVPKPTPGSIEHEDVLSVGAAMSLYAKIERSALATTASVTGCTPRASIQACVGRAPPAAVCCTANTHSAAGPSDVGRMQRAWPSI